MFLDSLLFLLPRVPLLFPSASPQIFLLFLVSIFPPLRNNDFHPSLSLLWGTFLVIKIDKTRDLKHQTKISRDRRFFPLSSSFPRYSLPPIFLLPGVSAAAVALLSLSPSIFFFFIRPASSGILITYSLFVFLLPSLSVMPMSYGRSCSFEGAWECWLSYSAGELGISSRELNLNRCWARAFDRARRFFIPTQFWGLLYSQFKMGR